MIMTAAGSEMLSSSRVSSSPKVQLSWMVGAPSSGFESPAEALMSIFLPLIVAPSIVIFAALLSLPASLISGVSSISTASSVMSPAWWRLLSSTFARSFEPALRMISGAFKVSFPEFPRESSVRRSAPLDTFLVEMTASSCRVMDPPALISMFPASTP